MNIRQSEKTQTPTGELFFPIGPSLLLIKPTLESIFVFFGLVYVECWYFISSCIIALSCGLKLSFEYLNQL